MAIAAGVGGGFMIANTANPHASKLEISRRMSAEPAAKASPTPSDSTPYLAATEPAAKPVSVSPAPQPQQEPSQPAPQQASQPNGPSAPPSETSAARDADPPSSAAPARSAQTAMREPSEPSNANAKARESDLKHAAAKKRRDERRQQWADRRHMRQDDELRDVEQKVREVTEGPEIDPAPMRAPRIGLFGAPDD
ncbi:hypothetical protein IC762_04455 [Bradyrhizobium genosp. L]|uniref:hypothetical protein n=1 Tax=Bradyrhizobium genosp. L TaxID=83637 RepID=UPI0018A2F153|nr:hypothetical protein [Bradyrhizobium genosp. L]QPF85581.1 hypothetical protein IC762_04455 [Bradyrhizobium genosp. L]